MKTSSALIDPLVAEICPLKIPMPDVEHGIVSQAVLTTKGLRLTLFRFAPGQELSEHATPSRALVQVVSGACDFSYSGSSHALKEGDLLHLPPGLAHAVRATGELTLLVTQVAPQASGD